MLNDPDLLEDYPEFRAKITQACETIYGFTPDIISTYPYGYRCVATYPQGADESGKPDNYRTVVADIEHRVIIA